jgi:molecular chaperone DnaK (HSP70)
MRYVIGIDLGTTNTCVAYADAENPHLPIQNLRIPQLKAPGYVEDLASLPSCCYLTSLSEWPPGTLSLPWNRQAESIVGLFARNQGARVPTKLVESAKSWLCYSKADRRDKILPIEAADQLQRISPIEASSRYLMHIRQAWDHLMGKNLELEFDQQEIVLTVPASFDEIARTLTVEAAKLAGFAYMTLLEEPQAAFYSWIAQNEKNWASQLAVGAVILVCDVGGGTTDFSLIEVVETNGSLGFQRMAVGNHLLLGGDNMDAAIAYFIEARLREQGHGECTSFQHLQMRHQARLAKESLLGENAASSYSVTIQGSGSHIIENTLSTTVHREEIEHLLMEGFWAVHSWKEALQLRKGSGFKAMGLPYEEEPSITKHLANFLFRSARPEKGILVPDFVLFNGGAIKPAAFQKAIMTSLKEWFPDKTPGTLTSYHHDLAVSRGAAYYGKVRRGHGVRIGGGTPLGYYLAVDAKNLENVTETKALTLLPRGSEEGSSYEPDLAFSLTPNTPVAFRIYTSQQRLYDKQGDLIPIHSEEMQLLPPIHTILRFGKALLTESVKEKIPVQLGVALTEIGTLSLWLQSQKTNHRWTLDFQLRQESGQNNSLAVLGDVRRDETFDVSFLKEASDAIRRFYEDDGQSKGLSLIESLEQKIGRPKVEWSPSILRQLWEELLNQAPKRKRSPEKEMRWWNLAGFFLRPGYGFPMDDFRMKELWKIILNGQPMEGSIECKIQKWICYRRIAGGLNKGQQTQLAADLFLQLYNKQKGRIEIKSKGELYHFQEKLRALASMELLEIPLKVKLGEALIVRMKSGEATATEFWALARIGARHLAYGSLANVVPRDVCSQWVETLLQVKNPEDVQLPFIIGQLARKTELRELNLKQDLLDKIIAHYQDTPHKERLRALLFEKSHLTADEQDQIFGDHLPLGISIDQ